MTCLISSRRAWVVPVLLGLILTTAACSFATLGRRVISDAQQEGTQISQDGVSRAYAGIYRCREEHGQLSYGSLGIPTQPGEKVSLVEEEMDFFMELEPGKNPGESAYSLQYQYTAHLLMPKLTYDDGILVKIEQFDSYQTRNLSNPVLGFTNSDGWFSGKWVETVITETPSEGNFTEGDLTQYFTGVTLLEDDPPRILLCVWTGVLDLQSATSAGVEGFAGYCADKSYVICTMEEPK